MKIIVFLVLSYLCGAIPFAFIIAKLFKNIDIRKFGSGNPGATNVYRTVSKPLGILTLALDILKGFIPVYVAMQLNYSVYFVLAVAIVTLLGHIFTIFLNFKGGKGVASGCGIFLAINPLATLICVSSFIIVLTFSKYVSLSSIIASIVLPISLYILNSPIEIVVFSLIAAIMVIARHIANIKRIFNGTENRIFGNNKKV